MNLQLSFDRIYSHILSSQLGHWVINLKTFKVLRFLFSTSLKLKIKLNKKNLLCDSLQNWIQCYLDLKTLNHLPCQMNSKDPLFWMDTHHVSNDSLLCGRFPSADCASGG